MEVSGVRMGKEKGRRRGSPPVQTVGPANLLFISRPEKWENLGTLEDPRENKPVDSSLMFLPALSERWSQRF